eukprot:TRINITY_DN12732_c0_g1_i1.p1 TRINITY_DN12732_c0_g1~~TRINITY_DN12732_c0_g1_i1.p1  ORF type:complete len:427 (-),score=66.08 TRINITY_DN12732_c0_g1_i1:26-1306(-)
MSCSFSFILLSLFSVLFICDARPLGAYLTNPIPRQRTYAGCKIGGPVVDPVSCPGPCEASYTPYQTNYTVARGDDITLHWPRNSHSGGFIRISWVEREAGVIETHAMFDQNVFEYGCYETTCWANQNLDGGNGTMGSIGGDNNDPDGLINPCTFETTVPLHLNDGLHTMQWAWYGGGGGFNGDYYSCVNYIIDGGAKGEQLTPAFTGGDASSPIGCKYWTTDRLHYCFSEPCSAICKNTTSPTGTCGGNPIVNGSPYIDPTWWQVNVTESSSGIPSSSSNVVVNPYAGLSANLTVVFPTDAAEFDVGYFVYDLANILEINKEAFTRITVRLDLSKLLATVIEFTVSDVTFNNDTTTVIDPSIVTRAVSNMIAQQSDALLEAFYIYEMQAFDPAEYPSNLILSSLGPQIIPSIFISFMILGCTLMMQ